MIKPFNMLDMVKGLYAFIVFDMPLSIIFLVLFSSSCVLVSL
jgi:hypothetical protein